MKNILFALAFIFFAPTSYSQQISDDTIHWSVSRKLDWKDFTEKATGKAGEMGHATMLMNAKFHKGLKATTSVETIFDRKNSYVPLNEQIPQELNYYQTLFDLYEVESRKLRKVFTEVKFGLDPDKVFQERYNAALKALSERVDDYMDETETGENAEEVTKWTFAVISELKMLEAFSK